MSTKYSKLFFVWVFATLVLAAPSIVAEESESAGFSAERLGLLDKSMQGYVDRKEVAGAVALVARRGKVVYHKSFGYRDVETEAPMSNDVIFRIASMTKPIVSVALMMLWEKGDFQLRRLRHRLHPSTGSGWRLRRIARRRWPPGLIGRRLRSRGALPGSSRVGA